MQATLEILDEVNIRFRGLSLPTRRKLGDEVKYFLPHAWHTPAYKLGRWDGCKRFCDNGGRSYFNLLDRLLPIVVNEGYELKVDDRRPTYEFDFPKVTASEYSHITWPEGHDKAGEPIVLRDYQVQIINTFLDNPQGIQEIATGAGKTIVTAALSHKVEKYGRSIVIVPNKDLVTQTEADYKNLGLDVGVYYGDRKEFNKTHTICTWQSLDRLEKSTKDGKADIPIEEFLDNVVCIMVDEVHKAKADVLERMLSIIFADQPLRWGLTGTIPPAEHEWISCLCTIGKVIGELSSKELQDQGILADLDIEILQLDDGFLEFGSYPQELKWLTTNPKRIDFISEFINTIAESGNTLILVDRIKTGEMLIERNPDWVFISGKVKGDDRKKEYSEISDSDNKVIVATFGVAAVGINIPRIFNLFLLEPGKSFIRVIQSIGRGIRKAKDKDYVAVYDITSTCKFSKRHLTKRKKFYKEREFRFSVTKVQYK